MSGDKNLVFRIIVAMPLFFFHSLKLLPSSFIILLKPYSSFLPLTKVLELAASKFSTHNKPRCVKWFSLEFCFESNQ